MLCSSLAQQHIIAQCTDQHCSVSFVLESHAECSWLTRACVRQGATGFEVVQVVPGGRVGLLLTAGAAAAVIGNSLLGTLLSM